MCILVTISISGCGALPFLSSLGGGSSAHSGVDTNANLNIGGEQNGFKTSTSNNFRLAHSVMITQGLNPMWVIVFFGGISGGLLFIVGLLIERPKRK